MKNLNLNTPFIGWLFSVLFWKVDFEKKGIYTRIMFFEYDSYEKDYYNKIDTGWDIHHLNTCCNIITVWYFKAN
jgi:hypothetical protein